jgi:hypothetical protein
VWTSTRRISQTGARSRRPLRRSERFAGIALFTLIALACANPPLLLFPFTSHDALRQQLTTEPDRGGWAPDYPAFLEDVRTATRRGDSIALLVPRRTWNDGYSYAYFRASYFLAGREVLPIFDEAGNVLPQNLGRARYLAAWRVRPPRNWRVVMSTHRGTLLVR